MTLSNASRLPDFGTATESIDLQLEDSHLAALCWRILMCLRLMTLGQRIALASRGRQKAWFSGRLYLRCRGACLRSSASQDRLFFRRSSVSRNLLLRLLHFKVFSIARSGVDIVAVFFSAAANRNDAHKWLGGEMMCCRQLVFTEEADRIPKPLSKVARLYGCSARVSTVC